MSDDKTAAALVSASVILRFSSTYQQVVKDWAAALEAGSVTTPATTSELYVAEVLAKSMGHARLAAVPQAVWVNGPGDIDNARRVAQDAKSKGQIPQFVVYWAVNRDNGQYSAGGAPDSASYRSFVDSLAVAIGGTGALINLEPDALVLFNGTPSTRYADLAYAGRALLAVGAKVFLSAGHSDWHSVEEIKKRAEQVGMANFTGFALNDSNYRPMSEIVPFGERLWSATNKPYMVDTSRNGDSPIPLPKTYWDPDWCNVASRRFGLAPRLGPVAGGEHCFGVWWVKHPGESDGTYNGLTGKVSDAPGAGQWFEAYADDMERNSGWS
ncbi:hypothetical protein GTQ99_00520 [Kineococcus sp. T13]|uniref:glycoside hydrolase family 6 protein n=1 Tax=Kineococcus vitellinus TaxID=2696565 RepID=UPI0014131562|nr:glycoside hydrolase family 6 protein [Kineococcus vitellinus]NAZ73915.1 hypothetical protein [Kineococcus vitellinus]